MMLLKSDRRAGCKIAATATPRKTVEKHPAQHFRPNRSLGDG
jgi:hypothetical protein